ncbi:Alpha/Beta hydrolase protein [Exophiala viscosa]|uniref:Alpha/Beta hydrolase protein n=1 Tax=Exophiala viscosa TaxID=2486360 RepID=UPI00218E336E|nr:Alpha/Beta hydrolase protein [Exophiala viscosa]
MRHKGSRVIDTRHHRRRVTPNQHDVRELADLQAPDLRLHMNSMCNGVPLEVFDGFRAAMVKDRAQFFIDVLAGPFFGFNRPNAHVSQGKIWSWWQQGQLCGFKAAYDCIKAFSETDTSEYLRNADIPILILHGTDDQVVPIDASARRAIKLCKKATLKEFPGAPHALPDVSADKVNQELLNFLQS